MTAFISGVNKRTAHIHTTTEIYTILSCLTPLASRDAMATVAADKDTEAGV